MDTITEVYNPFELTCTHSILEEFKKAFKVDKVEVTVKGWRNNSDIKWNAMVGTLSITRPAEAHVPLFSARIQPFTGNCGVKAISHLRFRHTSDIPTRIMLMEFLEDFLHHNTNCTLLVGSDHINGGTYSAITKFPGWNFTEQIPNYNYGESSDHSICAFWKLLPKGKYPNNYWGLSGVGKNY